MPEAKSGNDFSATFKARQTDCEAICFLMTFNRKAQLASLWFNPQSIRYVMSNKNYYSPLFHPNEAIHSTIDALQALPIVSCKQEDGVWGNKYANR